MAKKSEDIFVSTHAQVIVSDWKVFADIVAKHGKLIKEQSYDTNEQETSLPHVISRREIEDALNGPMQSFFKQKLVAYTKLSLIRMNLNMVENDTFKNQRADLPDADKVPENILKNTSLSDVLKIQKELDQLTKAHADIWDQHRKQWNQQILQRLSEQNLSLSEIEIKEFTDPEPISELLDRFVTLNIDLPRTRKSEMSFSKYLTLKADIAIQSALSRQHLPHAQSDIQKILNKLKPDFSTIAKQESQLIASQKTSTNEAVANISW